MTEDTRSGGAYEYRDKMLNIDALTIRDAQFIIREVKKIQTRSRGDLRPRMRAEVRCILEEVADGGGDPFAARRLHEQGDGTK